MIRLSVLFGLLIVAVMVPGASPVREINQDVSQRKDIELLNKLTQYVDHGKVIVDREGLKNNFFPLLGLGEKDKVVKGEFGSNGYGRHFSLVIRKVSRSGETASFFEVDFYSERHRLVDEGRLLFFEARDGAIYGKIPDDWVGVVTIYDLRERHYLASDNGGKALHSFDVPFSKVWTKEYSLTALFNAGKTIGTILEEILATIEGSERSGGAKYTESSEYRYGKFEKLKNKNRHMIIFE